MGYRLRIGLFIALILFPLASFALNTTDGTLQIPAGSQAALMTDTKIVCRAPTYKPAQCSNPSTAVAIPLTKTGDDFTVNFSTIQAAMFSDPRCNFSGSVCTVEASLSGNPPGSLANFTLNNVGVWTPGGGTYAWGATMADVESDLPDSLVASPTATCGTAPCSSLVLTLTAVSGGRITLADALPNEPAKLACAGSTFTAQKDTQGKDYFELSTIHDAFVGQQVGPMTPAAATNCQLQDSKENVYATIPTLSNISSQMAADSSGLIWAAEMPTITIGNLNYLVSKTQSNQAATNNYNQYTINVAAITPGILNFGGAIDNYAGSLYLACDSVAPIKLTSHQIDMYTLYGAIKKDSSSCQIESDPSNPTKLVFASFDMTKLSGNHYATAGGAPMWAMQVDKITMGASTYSVDATPVTSVCDVADPAACNQVTINFVDIAPGFINISGASPASVLICDEKTIPNLGTGSTLSFSLESIHALTSADPDTAVSFPSCYVEDGFQNIGSLALTAIEGARVRPDSSRAKMWSGEVSNLVGLSLDNTERCDGTTTYCNVWNLKIAS